MLTANVVTGTTDRMEVANVEAITFGTNGDEFTETNDDTTTEELLMAPSVKIAIARARLRAIAMGAEHGRFDHKAIEVRAIGAKLSPVCILCNVVADGSTCEVCNGDRFTLCKVTVYECYQVARYRAELMADFLCVQSLECEIAQCEREQMELGTIGDTRICKDCYTDTTGDACTVCGSTNLL
jgi:hypothetical protein